MTKIKKKVDFSTYVANAKAGKSPNTPEYMIGRTEACTMGVEELITHLMKTKKFVDWGTARRVCAAEPVLGDMFPGTQFNNRVDPKHIVGAFCQVLVGTDALLVNASGKYGNEKMLAKHTPFLKKHGFKVPPVKEKK